MSTQTRRNIESYSVTLYPTTLALLADWLYNGSDLNEIDWYRASWAKCLYDLRRTRDLQWEPFALSITLSTAGILLSEVEARLEAVDSMLEYEGPYESEGRRLLRERKRLLDDHQALLKLPF